MNFDTKIFMWAAVAAVILVGLVLVLNEYGGSGEVPVLAGTNLQGNVEFNVDDYSSKVTSEKAAEVILAFAEEEASERNSVELTVYNQNLGLVKEVRELELENGFNLVTYSDIPQTIKPESVLFKDLDFSDSFVVEQNYEYDLAYEGSLLEKYLGKEISVEMNGGSVFEGKLLSYLDNLVMETSEGIVSINREEVQNIQYPELAEGLLLKPSLIWTVHANTAGKRNTETSYLADGLDWEADYIAEVNEDDTLMDLKGWVTVENNTGTNYVNAALKLVAGELNIERDYGYRSDWSYAEESMDMAMPSVAGGEAFEEQEMFEYHMYSLKGKTTLKDLQEKQISLLTAEGVSVEKEYVYDDYKDSDSVQVRVNFTNAEEAGLGMALPAGTVRVYKKDSEGSLQFVGEDSIEHTGDGVERKLFLGNVFDLSVEKEQTSYEKVGLRCNRSGYKVTLNNSKEEEVTVTVVHHIWGDVDVVNSNYPVHKKSAEKVEFRVPVPANSEQELTFTLRRCW